ncbi:uncharacterized protein EV154DRAFT_514989, partial [Mucor mucedo]|uniref:uncharacterized protein n=1 Tax=Mucor mucedo TaxID=29922 RepID=UPI00221EB60E
MKITREEAICMLYGKEYSDKNAAELLKTIDEKELDVCYETSPLKPVLAPLSRILAEPHLYKRYKPKND